MQWEVRGAIGKSVTHYIEGDKYEWMPRLAWLDAPGVLILCFSTKPIAIRARNVDKSLRVPPELNSSIVSFSYLFIKPVEIRANLCPSSYFSYDQGASQKVHVVRKKNPVYPV